MKQPSPTAHGYDPKLKKWETTEGRENYRKEVIAYGKYLHAKQHKTNH